MKASDDEVKQAIGAVARLGGFQIKRVATTDDLKDRTLTITLTRASDGWVQDRLAFEEEADLVASVNGRGEVEHVGTGDPNDWKETAAETLTATVDPTAYPGEKVGEAIGEPREGVEAAVGEVVELNSKKRR